MSDVFAKIRACLQSEGDAEEVIREVIDRIEQAKGQIASLDATALDPMTDGETVRQVREEAQELAFTQRRLEATLPKLMEIQEKARYREEQERLLAAYEAAESKMADVEKALASRYPQLARELRLLLTASLEAMIEAQKINTTLPDDKLPIPIPASLLGDKPLYRTVTLPGHWKTKVDSFFYEATPSGILKINQ